MSDSKNPESDTDDKVDPAETAVARPARRLGIGVLSGLQVASVLCLFVALNFLSSQHHRPFDLSDNLGFTLSGSTTR